MNKWCGSPMQLETVVAAKTPWLPLLGPFRGAGGGGLHRQNYEVPTSPRLCAREAVCARRSTLSLLKICLRCDLTVSGAYCFVLPIR